MFEDGDDDSDNDRKNTMNSTGIENNFKEQSVETRTEEQIVNTDGSSTEKPAKSRVARTLTPPPSLLQQEITMLAMPHDKSVCPPSPCLTPKSSVLTRQDTANALAMKGMSNAGHMTKTEGTWAFFSPEMCRGGQSFSGYAADIWAAGVCLYIFTTGKLPFYSNIPLDLMEMIAAGDVPYEGLGLSSDLLELLQMALRVDPSKRAGVGDCLKHKFLSRARAQRSVELSSELAKSIATSTVVEEEDIQSVRKVINVPLSCRAYCAIL